MHVKDLLYISLSLPSLSLFSVPLFLSLHIFLSFTLSYSLYLSIFLFSLTHTQTLPFTLLPVKVIIEDEESNLDQPLLKFQRGEELPSDFEVGTTFSLPSIVSKCSECR